MENKRGVPGRPVILVVDDDATIRQLIREVLEGYDVLLAAGGDEALNLFKNHPEKKIDLVISDYDMPPGPNGVELLQRIRKLSPHTRSVLVSATVLDNLNTLAHENGFDSWLIKPFSTTSLEALVHRLVQNPVLLV